MYVECVGPFTLSQGQSLSTVYEKDYVAVNEVLTFEMCQKEACTEIVIMNDNIARKNRYFNLFLSQSTNEEIILTPNMARVEIIDKTSE